jgi:hypothetical protein
LKSLVMSFLFPFALAQIPFLGDSGWLQFVVWVLLFLIFILYGQRIQIFSMLREVEAAIRRLEALKNEVRALTIGAIKEMGKPVEDPTGKIDQILEFFTIPPVQLDPMGIVRKLEHILDVRDQRFKDDVRRITPGADEAVLNNLTNLLEAAVSLNYVYKQVRHFYLLGKRTSSFFVVLQIQMILPQVMMEAEAVASAAKAFILGQPLGDGVGALVAAHLMRNKTAHEIAKDIVMTESEFEGRRLFVMKAKGPGAAVGKPSDAINRIVEENGGKISLIVTVDAQVKLEGEKTGSIAEATGVAIGGYGVDKFKIEETASRLKVPVVAVLIKLSNIEALTPMKREVFEAATSAVERIKGLLRERTRTGDSVIVAGIGNTVGIM